MIEHAFLGARLVRTRRALLVVPADVPVPLAPPFTLAADAAILLTANTPTLIVVEAVIALAHLMSPIPIMILAVDALPDIVRAVAASLVRLHVRNAVLLRAELVPLLSVGVVNVADRRFADKVIVPAEA